MNTPLGTSQVPGGIGSWDEIYEVLRPINPSYYLEELIMNHG